MTNPENVNEIITINSATHPETGKAICIIKFGHMRKMAEPDIILNTARELNAAAEAAEIDVALMKVVLDDLELPDAACAAIMSKAREARPMPGGKVALRIEAVAGYHTRKPYIHVGLGSTKGSLEPNEARQMAQHWTEAAVTSHFDARLRYVLSDFDQLTEHDIENIFQGMLKAGGDSIERDTGQS
jgi:hypothetical protein